MDKSTQIVDLMTAVPATVAHDDILDEAHSIMLTHDFRHLPVLRDGRLCGIISDRDINLVASLGLVKTSEAHISEAMTMNPYAVEPGTPAVEVVAHMVAHKLGSTVIVEGDKVRGIFTTQDALEVLGKLLAST